MTESQHRFLKAIAERVTTGLIAEVRLFPTLRSGQVDSGVAIVAVEDLVAPIAAESDTGAPPDADEGQEMERIVADDPGDTRDARLSILTARFRHTVKGPDRGKWEFDIVHDADAPLVTIESVVRGVTNRAGVEGEPELLTGDDFQRVLSEPWWTTPA
ncbi:MAG TPA: hypothetical protein VF981_08950 [Gemmatimonadaceae bacterium]